MREFAIASLLISGILKAQLRIVAPWFPDVTMLSLGLFLISLVTLEYNRKSFELKSLQLLGVAMFILFMCLIAFSALYSNSELALTKLGKFLLVAFVFFIGVFSQGINLNKLAKYYIYLTILSCGFFLYIFPKFRLGLLGAEADFYSGSYLNFGDACAISLILIFAFLTDKHWLHYIFAVVLAFSLILSGARAPLLFLLLLTTVGLTIMLFKAIVSNIELELFKIVLFSIAITGGAGYAILKFDPNQYANSDIFKTLNHSLDRFKLLSGENKGSSVNVRLLHIEKSLLTIEKQPFSGVGLASYGKNVLKVDKLDYPHNMFLEVWIESGILALISLLIVISIVLLSVSVISFNPVLIFIVTYCLLNSMKSLSYADNRVMFFWFGLSLALAGKQLLSGEKPSHKSVK